MKIYPITICDNNRERTNILSPTFGRHLDISQFASPAIGKYAIYKLYTGIPLEDKEWYEVYIARDDQQGTLVSIVSRNKDFCTRELVYSSPKFCNTNYYRGNNLQLFIYKVTEHEHV